MLIQTRRFGSSIQRRLSVCSQYPPCLVGVGAHGGHHGSTAGHRGLSLARQGGEGGQDVVRHVYAWSCDHIAQVTIWSRAHVALLLSSVLSALALPIERSTREKYASTCVRRHQACALPPVTISLATERTSGPLCETLRTLNPNDVGLKACRSSDRKGMRRRAPERGWGRGRRSG